MKKRMVHIMSLVTIIALLAGILVHPALALTAKDEYQSYFLPVYNSSDELVALAVTVYNPGTDSVIAATYADKSFGDSPDTATLVTHENENLTLKYIGQIGSCYFWYISDDMKNKSYSGLLSSKAPVQGEKASAVLLGLDESDNIHAYVDPCTVGELSEGSDTGLSVIGYEGSFTLQYLPAFLIGDNGNCLGFIVGDGVFFTMWYDQASFNGGGTTSPGGDSSSSPKDPEPQPEPEPEPSTTTTALPETLVGSSATYLPVPVQKDVKKEIFDSIPWLAVIPALVVLAGGIAALIVFKRKKPEPVPVSPQPPQPPRPVQPMQPTAIDLGPITSDVSKPRQKRLRLICTNGVLKGRVYDISGIVTIGRNYNCTVQFPDKCPGVSRTHASLQLENGMLRLTDQSSTGTILARLGTTLPKNMPVQVEPGDVFYIGGKANCFEIVSE